MMIYDLYFQYPLAGAIILLGMMIFLPDSSILRKDLPAFLKSASALALIFMLSAFALASGDQPVPGASEGLLKASEFYQAGDFPSAEGAYKNLLKLPLSRRQNAIARYDIGTVLLSQGKNREAIEIFQEIALEDVYDPLLKYRLQTNLAVAYWAGSRGILFRKSNRRRVPPSLHHSSRGPARFPERGIVFLRCAAPRGE